MRLSGSFCRSNQRFLIGAGVITAAAIVAAVVWHVDPAEAWWMPKCPVKLLTGYDCPGCGATRALHAVLHGDFAGALRFNLFLVVGLGYAVAVFATRITPRRGLAGRFRSAVTGRTAAWIYLTLFFAWWILRNILGI